MLPSFRTHTPVGPHSVCRNLSHMYTHKVHEDTPSLVCNDKGQKTVSTNHGTSTQWNTTQYRQGGGNDGEVGKQGVRWPERALPFEQTQRRRPGIRVPTRTGSLWKEIQGSEQRASLWEGGLVAGGEREICFYCVLLGTVYFFFFLPCACTALGGRKTVK